MRATGLSLTTPRSSAAQLSGRAYWPRTGSGYLRHPDPAHRRLALARRWSKPAKRLQPGDRHPLRRREQGAAFWANSMLRWPHKGDAGEITLSFSFHGPVLDRCDLPSAAPCPSSVYCRKAQAGRARPAPTIRPCSPGVEGAVAAPTAGLHFTRHAARATRPTRGRSDDSYPRTSDPALSCR